ncbi:signal peptidase I [Halonatronum saccharophilum]|uniref:signal peptidase I n=1 Tax=Halonatronum saccharophilum TaxID=150060 RepID=UPI000482BF10|nr:signal peptidase I [Halonatronum saccharophilum]
MLITKEEVKEFFESLVIAGVLAFLIITFVAQSFVVQGNSMDSTLRHGERLFINKFIYRFQSPQRGDIIVLEPKGDKSSKYIKRVIGLPGDKVEIRGGKLFVNDIQIEEDYILEDMNRVPYGPYYVPENSVFALGDNRNNSTDSRRKDVVGYVPYDSIDGKAFWVWWPLNRMRFINSTLYDDLD